MKRKPYAEEQIIAILKEDDTGIPAKGVICKRNSANGAFYRWKSKFGGLEDSETERLR